MCSRHLSQWLRWSINTAQLRSITILNFDSAWDFACCGNRSGCESHTFFLYAALTWTEVLISFLAQLHRQLPLLRKNKKNLATPLLKDILVFLLTRTENHGLTSAWPSRQAGSMNFQQIPGDLVIRHHEQMQQKQKKSYYFIFNSQIWRFHSQNIRPDARRMEMGCNHVKWSIKIQIPAILGRFKRERTSLRFKELIWFLPSSHLPHPVALRALT